MKLFVAIPSVSSKIYSYTAGSLIELDRLLTKNNINIKIVFENNISIVHHVRNKLVTEFINKTDAEYILFLDDDIDFKSEDILKMINTNVKVIGGIYPYKHYNWDKIIKLSRLSANDKNPPLDLNEKVKNIGLNYAFTNPVDRLNFEISEEPIEVEGVGTGCLLIHRSVIEDMINTLSNIKYVLNGNEYYKIFDIQIENGELVSEDFWFCRRWREMGGKVHIATWAKCSHWGHHKYG